MELSPLGRGHIKQNSMGEEQITRRGHTGNNGVDRMGRIIRGNAVVVPVT
jgi:hypothetical protein